MRKGRFPFKPLRFFPLAAFLLLIPLYPSCRGSPPGTGGYSEERPGAGAYSPASGAGDSPGSLPRDRPPPAEEGEARALVPAFEAAPGVGIFTRNPRDPALKLEAEEKERISLSFRKAYAEALSRGLPLEGVLGGDQVHAWPTDSPLAWVQNWKSAAAYPNSWGLPSLVLAIRGFDSGAVFVVQGAILDAYGKSRGQGGANGVAGYGPPLSDEFPYSEGEDQGPAQGIAQRFGKGLMTADASGRAAFIPDEPPASPEGSEW
ncbi:MAG: hypothetical protein LBH26_02880 [Treponema sp.]|nr:hypothetical protein [Treponema sp.]